MVSEVDSLKTLADEFPITYLWIGIIVVIFILLIIGQLLIEYYQVNYYGQDVDLVYVLGIIGSLIVLFFIVARNKNVPNYKNWAILVSTMILIVTIVIQMFNKSVSIMGTGFSLITLFQYFTLENPDLKYIDELNALKIKAEEANMAKTSRSVFYCIPEYPHDISSSCRWPMRWLLETPCRNIQAASASNGRTTFTGVTKKYVEH